MVYWGLFLKRTFQAPDTGPTNPLCSLMQDELVVHYSDLQGQHFAEEIHPEPALPSPRTERKRPFSPCPWRRAGEAWHRVGRVGVGALLPMPGTMRGMCPRAPWPSMAPGPPGCWRPAATTVFWPSAAPGVRRSAGPRGQVLEAPLPRLSDQFGDLVRGQNQSTTAVTEVAA